MRIAQRGGRDRQRQPQPAPARRRGQPKCDLLAVVHALPGDHQRQVVRGPMRQRRLCQRFTVSRLHTLPTLGRQAHELVALQALQLRRHHAAFSTRSITAAASRRPPRAAPSTARVSVTGVSASAARRQAARSSRHSARTPPIAT